MRTADDRTEELDAPTADVASGGRSARRKRRRRPSDTRRPRTVPAAAAPRRGGLRRRLARARRGPRPRRRGQADRHARRRRAARAGREAKAAARLAHPGIVRLYESGRDEGAVYLVSELVRGRTLGELMEEGELSDRDVLRVGVALCDALAHAHGRGVVHRDVKPGNIMVPDDPQTARASAKLTDFGVARIVGDDALTAHRRRRRHAAYMAPEQAEGREAGGGPTSTRSRSSSTRRWPGSTRSGRGAACDRPARRRAAAGARPAAPGPPARPLRGDRPRRPRRGRRIAARSSELRAGLALALPRRGGRGGDDRRSPAPGRRRAADPAPPRDPPAGSACSPGSRPAPLVTAVVAGLGSPPPPPRTQAGAGPPPSPWPRCPAAGVARRRHPSSSPGSPNDGRAGTAVLVAAGAVPTAALVRRAGRCGRAPRPSRPRSASLASPGAWPALAGQARPSLAPPRARGARRLVARPGRGGRGREARAGAAARHRGRPPASVSDALPASLVPIATSRALARRGPVGARRGRLCPSSCGAASSRP